MSEFLRYTDPTFAAGVDDFTDWLDQKFADDPRYQRRNSKGEERRTFESDFDAAIPLGGRQGFNNEDLIIDSVRKDAGTTTSLCVNATIKEGRSNIWVAGAKTTIEERDGRKALSDQGEYMSVSTSYSSAASSDGLISVATGTRQVTVERDPTKSFLTDVKTEGGSKSLYPQVPGEVVFDTLKQIVTKHHKPPISK